MVLLVHERAAFVHLIAVLGKNIFTTVVKSSGTCYKLV